MCRASEAVPSARIVRATAQRIATATPTAVAFEREAWDTDGMRDAEDGGTGLVARTAGLYVITASLEWEANPLGWRTAALRLGDGAGAAFDRRIAMLGAATVQSLAAQHLLAQGDRVRLVVEQSSGLSLRLGGGSSIETCLAMTWLAPPPLSGSRAP